MTIKKIFKVIGFALFTFVAVILLYMSAAYCLSRIEVEEDKNTGGEITIYIKTNGVHTDIVVPVRNDQIDWSKEMAFANTKSGDTSCQFLGIGWGDKGFYLETPTWADLKASVAFKAATGLSTTAIHATYFKNMKESSTCKKIRVSKVQYSRLVDYIHNSLQIDREGYAVLVKSDVRYGQTDAFYEATGSYSIFRTCNTWANEGLKTCGQKSCFWTPFDTGIFLHYK